jgi:hypothetical protein
MPETRSSSTYSYSVFRFVKDARRDISIPVGVALWSEDANWYAIRLIQPNEKIPRISRTTDQPFIGIFTQKLNAWLAAQDLPYSERTLKPASDAWWAHLQKLLVHKVRVSEPRPIDCLHPERELDSLFKEIVGNPETTEENMRVDHMILHCLGPALTRSLCRGELPGYAGKPVQVMRYFSGTQATVVVEGVNLGLENAAAEADTLVGKLRRVRANGTAKPRADRPVIAIVGYLASANGLNRESFLRDWIQEAGEATVVDVEREASQLREATKRALDQAGPPPALVPLRS